MQGYGYGNGDLIVNIGVYIPESLNAEERAAFEKLRESDNMRPSKKSKENFFNRFKKIFE